MLVLVVAVYVQTLLVKTGMQFVKLINIVVLILWLSCVSAVPMCYMHYFFFDLVFY